MTRKSRISYLTKCERYKLIRTETNPFLVVYNFGNVKETANLILSNNFQARSYIYINDILREIAALSQDNLFHNQINEPNY